MNARRRKTAIARIALSGATVLGIVVVAPLASFAPTNASAKGTRLVKTACCSAKVPAFLKFTVDGDIAEAENGGLSVAFGRRISDDPLDLIDGEIDTIGGGYASYKAKGTRWMVKSGTLYGDETIFYIRAAFDPACQGMGLLTMQYPVSKKAQFSAAVSAISKSFSAVTC